MPEKKPLDRLEADATQAGPVKVALADVEVEVLPQRKWKSSAIHALNASGDVEVWASKCLTPESYKAWQKVDPDLEQVEDFFVAWAAATGESVPE
jgi:hypothetical protein